MLIILILLLLTVVGVAVMKYNNLQSNSQGIKKQSSNVQIAVSRKMAVINQLIDAVKSHQEGEQLVQLKISQDNTKVAIMNAYQQSGSTLAGIQGVADRFPNLKASDQYQRLMKNIEECELNIEKQRTIYNSYVEKYNVDRLRIPTIFIAQSMGFSEAPYLEFDMSGAVDVTSLKEFKTDDGERLQQLFSGAGNSIAGAAKNLAGHASQATRLLGDKIKEKKGSMYFYMLPGNTPKGPVTTDEIKNLHKQNILTDEAKISIQGSDEWKNIQSLLAELDQINPEIN